MIFKKLGICDIKITGNETQRLLSALLVSNISLSDIEMSGGVIYGRVLSISVRKLKKLCVDYSCTLETVSERGVITVIKKYGKHYGIYFGILVLILLLNFVSNHILQIKIVGADSEAREQVYAVLEDMDIGFGTFIPGISFYEVETALTLDTDCIAWAGIRSHGSTLIINISQTKQTPEMTEKRVPANIISTKNAVITGAQVYSGSLSVMVGDAVAKGQILVSGEYKDIHDNFCYRYAQASVTGTYSETAEFSQKLCDIEKVVTPNVMTEKRLSLFDAEISFDDPVNGRYIENKSTTYFSFLGLELPVGITHITYDEYDYTESVQSYEQARVKLYDDIERYEENFLSDRKILDKEVRVNKTNDGLDATVYYVINGEIGETQTILAKKD